MVHGPEIFFETSGNLIGGDVGACDGFLWVNRFDESLANVLERCFGGHEDGVAVSILELSGFLLGYETYKSCMLTPALSVT